MTLKPAFAAALLAFFAAACQPDSGTAGTEAAAPAPAAAGTAASLANFKKGEFADLNLDQDLSLPTSPFVDGEGKPHSFEEFKGKVVVYNIWAEWCGPCIEEMPTLAGLQKAFAGKDVVVVPVAAGYADKRDSTKAMLTKLVGSDLPFFYDDSFNVNADAKSGSFPATIIYGKDGKEVARLEVPAKWDSPEAVALVQAVLDGRT
ncbi:MAG: TlpA disulfide reductase family protein [Hyphomonadaceae bacterium]|nr:TlpA disulfide reductase family protein [Hyphomonadaceae bacterium]